MNRYDDKKIYCRRLGHHVAFSYCRQASSGMVCRGIVDCWFERIPIREYLEQHFTTEQLRVVFQPPKPKVSQILDIVARVKDQAAP